MNSVIFAKCGVLFVLLLFLWLLLLLVLNVGVDFVTVFVCSRLQESFEGQMTEDNIELGICNEQGFKRLSPSEVKDYLASIPS